MKSRGFPLLSRAAGLLEALRLERWTTVAVCVAFLAALAVVLLTTQFKGLSLRGRANGWEPGKVAEKDYVVERDFLFVDERATDLRRDSQERRVPPVFSINTLVGSTALETYDRFSQSLQRLVRQGLSPEKIYMGLRGDFPGRLSRSDIRLLVAYAEPPPGAGRCPQLPRGRALPRGGRPARSSGRCALRGGGGDPSPA